MCFDGCPSSGRLTGKAVCSNVFLQDVGDSLHSHTQIMFILEIPLVIPLRFKKKPITTKPKPSFGLVGLGKSHAWFQFPAVCRCLRLKLGQLRYCSVDIWLAKEKDFCLFACDHFRGCHMLIWTGTLSPPLVNRRFSWRGPFKTSLHADTGQPDWMSPQWQNS